MSVIRCEHCDGYKDESEIEVWEPDAVCQDCFTDMDPVEIWNLAIKSALNAVRVAGLCKSDPVEHIKREFK